MRVCPHCGREVTEKATSCETCGAHISQTHRIRRYISSATALVAIIVAAGLAHSLLRSRVVRPPTDFLPCTTRAVVALDLRTGTPAMLRIQQTWQQSDIEHLARRATPLLQDLVDWTGLDLDLNRDVSQWFGGEVLAAAVGGPELHTLHPRTFVLLARATNLRRARRSLDKAVARLAREAGWQRSVIRRGAHAVTVWSRPAGKSAIAYAAEGGCLLISPNDAVIQRCLEAASDPSQGLSAMEDFKAALRALPPDSFVWGYGSAPHLLRVARELLPQLPHGWVGVVEHYRAARLPPQPLAPTGRRLTKPLPSSLAVALTPEREGIRLHLSYRRPDRRQPQSPAPALEKLAELVPREAIAYALLQDPARWLTPVASSPAFWRPWLGTQRIGRTPIVFCGPISALLQPDSVPGDTLVALLPRGAANQSPAVVVATACEGPADLRKRLSQQLPGVAAAEIEHLPVYASDEEALRQCRRASADAASRLPIVVEADTEFQAWARPAELAPALDDFQELRVTFRRQASGVRGDVHLKAEPRHLLGRMLVLEHTRPDAAQ